MTDDRTINPFQRHEPSETANDLAAGQADAPVGGEPTADLGGDGDDVHATAEEDVWTGRTSWKHYAGRLIAWLAANVVVAILLSWLASGVDWLAFKGVFWTVVILVVVSGILVLGRVFVRILGNKYRLTSQRLFIERGIFSQTVDQTELIRVDDVRIYKSMLDRVFGLGTVAILSTDATDREVRIEGIGESERVAESIRSRMRAMRRKSLFVENL